MLFVKLFVTFLTDEVDETAAADATLVASWMDMSPQSTTSMWNLVDFLRIVFFFVYSIENSSSMIKKKPNAKKLEIE